MKKMKKIKEENISQECGIIMKRNSDIVAESLGIDKDIFAQMVDDGTVGRIITEAIDNEIIEQLRQSTSLKWVTPVPQKKNQQDDSKHEK